VYILLVLKISFVRFLKLFNERFFEFFYFYKVYIYVIKIFDLNQIILFEIFK